MNKHLNLKVSGKVQGVGFRYQAKEFAAQHDVRGYARNMRDSTVELEIEGKEEDLKGFLAWCKSNENPAIVNGLDINEGDVQGYREFQTY